MTNEFILEKAQVVADVGILYALNNIIGMPYETRELFFETVRLNRQIGDFDSLSVNIFVPYHCTLPRHTTTGHGH